MFKGKKKTNWEKHFDLNDRLRETNILSQEKKRILNQKAKPVISFNNPSDYKNINKANRKAQGIANVKNEQGFILEVKNLNKYYVNGKNTYHVLKNVNLKIKKGEFISIVGASGSGKTTLLNIISGLDRTTQGSIIFNNVNIAALSNGDLTTFRRNNIGFIFQSYNLLPELSALDNVIIGQKLQIDGNKRISGKELLNSMNLESFVKTNVQKLSGGQQQRISVARALAKNPEIIFADEPTGALDSQNSLKMMEVFQKINKRYGTTIVLVTHNPVIQKLTDRSILVNDGFVTG